MDNAIGLDDVSTKDTGSGSQLKTGGRRKHNMVSKCKTGQTRNKSGKCVSVKSLLPKGLKRGPGPKDSPSMREAMLHKSGVKKSNKIEKNIDKYPKLYKGYKKFKKNKGS